MPTTYAVCKYCAAQYSGRTPPTQDRHYTLIVRGFDRLTGYTREGGYERRAVLEVKRDTQPVQGGCQSCGVGANDIRDQERFGWSYYGPYVADCSVTIADPTPIADPTQPCVDILLRSCGVSADSGDLDGAIGAIRSKVGLPNVDGGYGAFHRQISALLNVPADSHPITLAERLSARLSALALPAFGAVPSGPALPFSAF